MLRTCLGLVAHLAWVLLLLTPDLASAQDGDNVVCASCHEEIIKKVGPTAHGKVACAQCHPKHEEYPHPEKVAKPECGSCHADAARDFSHSVHGEAARKKDPAAPDCATCHGAAHEVTNTGTVDFRKASVESCGMCHDKAAGEFNNSIHGKAALAGSAKAPVCSDCHNSHDIQRPGVASSRVSARNVPQTCGSCHSSLGLVTEFRPDLDRVTTFQDSFHGLALKAGSTTVANCASCHGVHNILPSDDPKSMIHASNVAATCGRCHPGAGERFALGPVHVTENQSKADPVTWVRWFYLLVIPATLGLMFIHNLGDFVRKLWKLRLDPDRHRSVGMRVADDELRMYPAERMQHALLATSFIVLTWTGFALIYPDAWWARPLLLWEDRYPVRGVIHRVAAIVFMVVAFLHLILTFKSRHLRHHWRELLPRWTDIREASQNFAFNLGLRKERPVLSSHSYVEKAEYWAVVWGFIVMALTGLLLWFNNWSLRMMPKWVLDVATAVHFYEAVLAAAAIVIWHFYFVIVDPDVYPMDTAWLTGKSVRVRRRAQQNVEDAHAQPDQVMGD